MKRDNKPNIKIKTVILLFLLFGIGLSLKHITQAFFGIPQVKLSNQTIETNSSIRDQLRAAIQDTFYSISSDSTAISKKHEALNLANRYTVYFTEKEVEVVSKAKNSTQNQTLKWQLKGWGYTDNIQPVSSASAVISHNRVEYRRGNVTEWYINDPSGLEQGFTLHQKPVQKPNADQNWLEMRLDLSGDISPSLTKDQQTIVFHDQNANSVLQYGGLYAFDATGRKLPSELSLFDNELSLRVNDKDAVYPVTIDPKLTATLTASDGETYDLFGLKVAISTNTAAVSATGYLGGPGAQAGAVYIFEYNGSNKWNQVQKIYPNDPQFNDAFGKALSLEGNTLAVGARGVVVSEPGRVYIFERNPNTKLWSQVDMLTASDFKNEDQFGRSIELEGNRMVIGSIFGGNNNAGAAYVFEYVGGAWTELQKLTASDSATYDFFGFAVSLKGDKLLVGAPSADDPNNPNNYDLGAVYSFEFDSGNYVWNEVQKFTSNNPKKSGWFGFSIDMNGTVAVIGEPYRTHDVDSSAIYFGAAYIFNFNGNIWQQTQRIADNDPTLIDSHHFGYSVAMRDSGDMVVVGAPDDDFISDWYYGEGAAYVFKKDNANSWYQSQKLSISDNTKSYDLGQSFGNSMAISKNFLIVGAFKEDVTVSNVTNKNQGVAHIYDLDLNEGTTILIPKFNRVLARFILWIPPCDITPGGIGGPWGAQIPAGYDLGISAAAADGKTASPIVAITQRPVHGTLRIEKTEIIYTPNKGYVGSDHFVFEVLGDKEVKYQHDLTVEIQR